jgi:hypothetical protein
MPPLILNGTVGPAGKGKAKGGIPYNQEHDIIEVRKRLKKLGFDWIPQVKNASDQGYKEFIDVVKLFQCICHGSPFFMRGTQDDTKEHKKAMGYTPSKHIDGKVERGGFTHKWLQAKNAPKWVDFRVGIMEGPDEPAVNPFWRLVAKDQDWYGTSWLYERIEAAAWEYWSAFCRAKNADPDTYKDPAPPMWIRAVAKSHGGAFPRSQHASHQTGLDVDMRLPSKAPDTYKYDSLGQKPWDNNDTYYSEVVELQLKAINDKMAVRKKVGKKYTKSLLVLFNDPAYVGRLCTKSEHKDSKGNVLPDSHDFHYHIRIAPPEREP